MSTNYNKVHNDCDCGGGYGVTQVAVCPGIHTGSLYDFTGFEEVRIFHPAPTGTTYEEKSYVWYKGYFYQCIETHTATEWEADKWKKTNLLDLIDTVSSESVDKLMKIIGNVDVYDPEAEYGFGSFILDEDGYLNICVIYEPTPGEFVPEEWTRVSVLTLLTDLANAVDRLMKEKQDKIDEGLMTESKVIVDAINEIWNVAVRKKTLVFDNYIDMCSDTGDGLNNSQRTASDLAVPDEIIIKNINVSDAWVNAVNDEYVYYDYENDATVESDLESNTLRIGYWTLSKLETKVRISNASATNDGLMSKADYVKLRDIPADTADQLSGLTQSIENEKDRATEAEGHLNTKIENEITRATGAEGDLNIKIENETTRATGKENELTQAISDETTRATKAEGDLGALIDQEKSRAEAKEAELADAISAEASTARDEEGKLSTAISEERTRATGVEEQLGRDIAEEIVRATGAEEILTQIIAGEKSRAEGAENDLNDKIDAEKDRAEGKEAELTGAISAEASKAREEEGKLNTAISEEEARATGVEEQLGRAIMGLIGDVEAQGGQIDELSSITQAQSSKIDALSGTTQDHADKISGLTDTVTAHGATLEAHTNQISGLTGTTQAQGELINDLSAVTTGHTSQISGLTETVTNQGVTIGNHTTQIDTLNTTTQTQGNKIDELSGTTIALAGRVTDVESGLSTEANRAKAKEDELEAKITGNTEDISQIDERLKPVESLIDVHNVDIEGLKNLTSAHTEDIRNLKERAGNLEDVVDGHSGAIEALAGVVEGLSDVVEAQGGQIDSLNTTVGEHTDQISDLTDITAQHTSAITKQAEDLIALAQRVTDAEGNIENHGQAIAQNIIDITKNANDIAALTISLNNTKADLTALATIVGEAPDYQTTETYMAGDLVKKDGVLYECLEDNTTGEWDATKWRESDIIDQIDRLIGRIDSAVSELVEDLETGVVVPALADNLYSPADSISEAEEGFIFRTAGGSSSLRSGSATLNKVIGNHIVRGTISTGSASQAFTPGNAYTVTVTNLATLKTKITDENAHSFSYDGSAWSVDGTAITSLADYGLSVGPGTPAKGDGFSLTISADNVTTEINTRLSVSVSNMPLYKDHFNEAGAQYDVPTSVTSSYNGSTWNVDLTSYGVTINSAANAIAGDSVTLNYTRANYGEIIPSTTAGFRASGLNAFDKETMFLSGYTINTSGKIVAQAGSFVCYAPAAYNVDNNTADKYNGYIVRDFNNSVTRLGWSSTVPVSGATVTLTNSGNLSYMKNFTANGYIVFSCTNKDKICVHPSWTGYMDDEYAEFSESIIEFGGIITLNSVGDYRDELDLEAGVHKRYISLTATTEANLAYFATWNPAGDKYIYDNDHILYYDPAKTGTTTILVDNVYTVNDFGTEEFAGTLVGCIAEMSYGENLRDKLRNDVVVRDDVVTIKVWFDDQATPAEYKIIKPTGGTL